jgi:sugar lactone lactonase YvrE
MVYIVLIFSYYPLVQWEFNDERVLQCPLGISVDNDGNVYVVGCHSNNVMVISPDGQRHRQLLASKDVAT